MCMMTFALKIGSYACGKECQKVEYNYRFHFGQYGLDGHYYSIISI